VERSEYVWDVWLLEEAEAQRWVIGSLYGPVTTWVHLSIETVFELVYLLGQVQVCSLVSKLKTCHKMVAQQHQYTEQSSKCRVIASTNHIPGEEVTSQHPRMTPSDVGQQSFTNPAAAHTG
jgi:hypothetical protein